MSTNPFNPFSNVDFSKFDLSKFDMTKMMGDVKIPGFDMEAVMTAQRKNIEALTHRQSDGCARHAGGSTAAGRDSESGDERSVSHCPATGQQREQPQEMTTKQAELARKGFRQALSNMRELAEMVSKSNTDAFAVINGDH